MSHNASSTLPNARCSSLAIDRPGRPKVYGSRSPGCFAVHRANLFQAAFDGLSSAAVPRGIRTSLPANGEEISYTLSFGKQTAFHIPPRESGQLPVRLWVAFCGNGSLALDWTTILEGYPNSHDAFLLVDYSGYGKCQGYATIAGMRALSDAALKTLTKRLALSEEEMESRLCTIGDSLGSAVAIDFGVRHRVQRVLAIAPFTTLREEAARVITSPLSYLLIESYDNRAGIAQIRKRNPEAKIAIFHGTNDEVIPVVMGRDLAQKFPFIDFFPVEGANHVCVLSEAHDQIIRWMNN